MEETVRLMIRDVRKKAGITQLGLAKEIGVDTKTIGNWERGETIPNAAQVWACAVALGTDPNTVLGWYEEHPREAPAPDPAHRGLVESYDSLSEEGREVADSVMAGLRVTHPKSGDLPCLGQETA